MFSESLLITNNCRRKDAQAFTGGRFGILHEFVSYPVHISSALNIEPSVIRYFIFQNPHYLTTAEGAEKCKLETDPLVKWDFVKMGTEHGEVFRRKYLNFFFLV